MLTVDKYNLKFLFTKINQIKTNSFLIKSGNTNALVYRCMKVSILKEFYIHGVGISGRACSELVQ